MVKLPAVISDGMVIEKQGRLWGEAAPDEKLAVTFCGRTWEVTADECGRFEVNIEAEAYGGPYELIIGDRVIRDVMVGYVWLCGGQSNMELPVSRVRRAFEDEMARVNCPALRAYLTEKSYAFDQADEWGKGRWIAATPEQINHFYAGAYFFAAELYKTYGVPVGLLCCAAGGSTAESWMREEILTPFPEAAAVLKQCQAPGYVRDIENTDLTTTKDWHDRLNTADAGLQTGWEAEDCDDSAWAERLLTAPWDGELAVNGAVWFRKTVELPAAMAGKPATLWLGRIVDSEYVYVNGVFSGRVEYQYPPRIFPLPPGLLKAGKNVIAVRVISQRGLGGFIPDKPYKLQTDTDSVCLEGVWKYKIGAVLPEMPETTFFYRNPAGLHNAMLHPLVGFGITGAIWYQGESNTENPDPYAVLMRTLIADWRRLWRKEFPFLFVQLANFEAHSAAYPDSRWAELREQQQNCLDVPHTAMAVAIDCGEYNDLHPLDKKTVGQRLALAARKLAYGEDVVYSGPIAQAAVMENGKIVIAFTHTGGGLAGKQPYLTVSDGAETLGGFEIETEDGNWQETEAIIEGETVTITAGDQPVTRVRYAWADQPKAVSLYNREGLPASPFRLPVQL